MMEVQLLEGFHHAWRGRMRFSSQWVWKRAEFQGNNSKPKTTAALRREQEPEPHIQNLGVITDNKLQTTCSPNQPVQAWGKLWVKAACEQCVSTWCPRMLQNETLQRKGKRKKEEQRSTPKMHWIFQQNKEEATREEQKYPKGASKTMSGDHYRLGFKAANMLRVGADPWLERAGSTKHCVLRKKMKVFSEGKTFPLLSRKKEIRTMTRFCSRRVNTCKQMLLTVWEQHSTHQNSLSWTTFCNLLLI